MRSRACWVGIVACLAACSPPPPPPSPQEELIAKGRDLFFNETFQGNGRTCGTCHPALNNLTLDPAFIAQLPADDPLFVAETNPNLRENFENPRLMRGFSQILENLDGFGDLPNRFVMRGIPHTIGLRNTIDSPAGPRTGWSGDGAPGDGSLRSFATGAVIQHFTKSLNRVAGVDFRLPTDAELDALEAFQLSLGRQAELALPLPLKGVVPLRGQEIFMDQTLGKCTFCHDNAGANANIPGLTGNQNFNTGVEELPDQPADLTGELVPPDDGFGTPGDSTFNVPSLVEAADTGPFFHNNSVETIEAAVAFYDGEAFNNSPTGRLLASIDPNGTGIELDATQIVAIAAFLRVINALENIRQSVDLLDLAVRDGFLGGRSRDEAIAEAGAEIDDAIEVLAGARLHPEALAALTTARDRVRRLDRRFTKDVAREALAALEHARSALVGE
jgi:hypothetical protein